MIKFAQAFWRPIQHRKWIKFPLRTPIKLQFLKICMFHLRRFTRKYARTTAAANHVELLLVNDSANITFAKSSQSFRMLMVVACGRTNCAEAIKAQQRRRKKTLAVLMRMDDVAVRSEFIKLPQVRLLITTTQASTSDDVKITYIIIIAW